MDTRKGLFGGKMKKNKLTEKKFKKLYLKALHNYYEPDLICDGKLYVKSNKVEALLSHQQ
jgi:hypothetical protein